MDDIVKRNAAILADRAAGKSLRAIAAVYALSAEGVRKIVTNANKKDAVAVRGRPRKYECRAVEANAPGPTEVKMRGDLMTLASAFSKATDLALSTIGLYACKNAKMFTSEHRLWCKNYDRAVAWFAGNWPQGLAWPEGIERP